MYHLNNLLFITSKHNN